MQVRPLRRYRVLDKTRQDKRGNYLVILRYGDQSYLTHDREFAIRLVDGQWRISNHAANIDIVNMVGGAGLFHAAFPRRCDAVEALEELLQSL